MIQRFVFLPISSSYLKLLLCWLQAFTPVTYLSKLPGMNALAVGKQLQLFRGAAWRRIRPR
ncbi:hypothetical protein AS658_15035 [Serratia marcescens]|nr:hypothetical protein AM681_15175 [Serratia marcescens]AVU40978.1 hypothetical protein AS658_15035 [Serratia marcescens]